MSDLAPNYTRHRESTSVVDHDLYEYRQISYAGTVSDPWKISSDTLYPGDIYSNQSKQFDDCITPEWSKKRCNGIIVNNPMHSSETLYSPGVGSYTVNRINRNGTSPNYYYTGLRQSGTRSVGGSTSDGGWFYPASPDVDESVIQGAIADSWARVSFNEAQVLQQLGELHETIGSLVSIVRRVLKIFRNVKNFRLKELLGEISPKELANRYMEARYALRPLMYDMKGTIRAIQGEHKCSPRQTFRGYARSVNSNSQSNVQLYHAEGNFDIYGSTSVNRTLEVRAGVLTSIDSQLLITMNNWGIDEPFQTVWELIPFSFIVDWFCNVGKIIAAWSPKPSFRILASWYTATDTVCQTSTAETGVSLMSYNYENSFSRLGTYSKVAVVKYRYPNPDRPILPRFNVKLNPWKTLDLGVILNQLLHFTRFF